MRRGRCTCGEVGAWRCAECDEPICTGCAWTGEDAHYECLRDDEERAAWDANAKLAVKYQEQERARLDRARRAWNERYAELLAAGRPDNGYEMPAAWWAEHERIYRETK